MSARPSEAERATDRLRDEIVTGVRAPGSKLIERDIAEEYGVSRVPVRSALLSLAREGIVVTQPWRAATVREFSPSDVVDLYEVCSALDVLSFRLAAQRHTRQGLQRLRAVLDEGIAAAAAGDAVVARRAAAEFHAVVMDLSGNELLEEISSLVRARLRWLMGQHDDLVQVAADHEEIFQAIAVRDADLVERLIHDHLTVSRSLKAGYDRARTDGTPPPDRPRPTQSPVQGDHT